MKNVVLVFLLPLLYSCASAPGAGAQYSLDGAAIAGADCVAGKIPPSAKIAFVSMQSPSANMSAYVIDSVITRLVNKNAFIVIERSELNTLEQEQRYQLSGKR